MASSSACHLLRMGSSRARSSASAGRQRGAARSPRSASRLALDGGQLQRQGPLAAGQRVDLVGLRVELQPQAAARLVQQVDGLVGQGPPGDVAARQLDRGHQGGVLDAHAVLVLVAAS